jgi:hypothetical protein
MAARKRVYRAVHPAAWTQVQAQAFGPAWPDGHGPVARFDSVREAGEWARSHGAGADRCDVTQADGGLVARWTRDPNDPGTRWHRVRD